MHSEEVIILVKIQERDLFLENLILLMECPYIIVGSTMPKLGFQSNPSQVSGELCVAYLIHQRASEAIKGHIETDVDMASEVIKERNYFLRILTDIMSSPFVLDEATIPLAGIAKNPEQVVGNIYIGGRIYSDAREAIEPYRVRNLNF